MAVVSVVVEVEDGTAETVLNSLAFISQISVYGVKDNQIVAVVEDDDDLLSVNRRIECIFGIDKVTGVYPVYAEDDV